LRLEGQKYNILVNALAPVAGTRMTESLMTPEVLAKLDPSFVSPMVAYLCSEQCQRTGEIWSAGAGNFARIEYREAPGVRITGRAPTVEDVADNIFNPDPYYQQGGDMVRAGGISYTIDLGQPIGRRISELTLLRTGEPLDPGRDYVVAGWASVNEGTQGPPIWDVVFDHLRKQRVVAPQESGRVKVVGG